jgi:hypothetical protein
MIRFVTTRDHASTLAAIREDPGAPPIEILSYDRLLAAKRLPRASYVFTDLDRLSAWDLELAAIVHRRLAEAGVRVWNDPARVKTRFALLRALHQAGVNGFNGYRVDEGLAPARYPVLLRREAGHGTPLGGLLADAEALARAVDDALARGIPARSLLVIEYAAEPVRPGLFRKLSVARLGGRFETQLCVHDEHWLVKYGKRGCAPPELYEEELNMLRENRFAADLRRAFEIAGIEYGRADFGLVGGRVQVYEINTNPSIKRGGPHPSPQRVQSQRLAWTRFVEALRELDDGARGGPSVRIADPRLARHQGWRGRFVRTRRVP